MSDDTFKALEEALSAHVLDEMADEGALMLTDWAITAACALGEDGVTGYLHVLAPHTPAHTRLGLARVGWLKAEQQWLVGPDDD